MTEHTPGPWTVDRRGDGAGNLPIRANGLVIAGIRASGTRSDARLIAAAPELLEACKAALPGPLDRQPWHSILVAAITKATMPVDDTDDEPDGAGRDPDLGAVDYRETLERGHPEAGR